MKKIMLLAAAMALVWAGSAQAHPPSQVKLDYHLGDQMLHVTMKHVTHDPQEHRIREIVVFVNGQDVGHFYFVQQTSAQGLEEALPVSAKAGDDIRVKAICSKAGVAEAGMTVPSEE